MEDIMDQSQQPQPEPKEEHDDIDTGSEIVSRKRILLVEPFNPEENPHLRTRGTHASRVVLLKRSFLAPMEPEKFVKEHGFVSIDQDKVAINPDYIPKDLDEDEILHVRRFVRDPSKPPFKKEYKSELFWDGGFIRLVTEPLALRALLRPRRAEPAPAEDRPSSQSPAQPQQPSRRRRGTGFPEPGVK
jgi:hypothetical protein